ncbi:Hypothetical protein FKW44_017651, partial [Caligus rogercresseyi]
MSLPVRDHDVAMYKVWKLTTNKEACSHHQDERNFFLCRILEADNFGMQRRATYSLINLFRM